MNTPTPQQKVLFTINSYAGLVSGKNPPEHADIALYDLINSNFQKYEQQLGKWNIVWGPIVVTYDTFYYPINAMYMAQSEDDPSQYVISVAGTNPLSIFDWFVEDALVEKQVPWPFDAISGGAISLGTAIGLVILLSSVPSSTLPGAGLNVRDFLKGLQSKKIHLTTGGHSLGGALSPALGLWLKNTQILWDPFFEAKFASQPTAGPTAGNSVFAQYLSEKIPLTRFWNTFDIVPHAWVETLLAELPTIYAPDIPSDAAIRYFVSLAQNAAKNGDYTQLEPDSAFSPGVNTGIIKPGRNLLNYLVQVAYQHTVAYSKYFEIPGVSTENALLELYPETQFDPQVIARQAARTGTTPPPELLEVTAPAGLDAKPITVPINGQPTLLPASADDPATDAIASAVQAELAKYAV